MTMDDQHLNVDEISTSNLHCFCDDLEDEDGYFSTLNRRHSIKTLGGDRYEDIEGYLCRDYLEYEALVALFGLIVPLVVVSLN